MQIVAYRDLESKDGLLPLMEQAFGWPFNEEEFDKFIKLDPRLRKGVVGFCALENGRVVSFVGAMDLATRTLDGTVEPAGGVYGVATLPGYTRQGFSTALFKTTHEHFKNEGYRFSFLNTSRALVAYSLYKKLGYSDVYSYPSVYKVLDAKKATPSRVKTQKLDLNDVLASYNKYMSDKVGLTVRDRAFLKMLVQDKRLTSKGTVRNDKGYVVFIKGQYSTRIWELVAQSKTDAAELVKTVEGRARGVVFGRAVLDKTFRQVYSSQGYKILDEGHGVFMIRPLESSASLRQVYGEDFFQTPLDSF
jgi:GNAT superfamily N-acetyltransferase